MAVAGFEHRRPHAPCLGGLYRQADRPSAPRLSRPAWHHRRPHVVGALLASAKACALIFPLRTRLRLAWFARTPHPMRREAKSKREPDRTAEAIRSGDRVALARAITLIESAKPEDQAKAQALVEQLLPYTGKSVRVGISGVPGAGKSTLIDQLGLNLVAQGHKVAVLAVDPTSSRSGGSILGDKTRMGRLATEPSAFIRPSPAGDNLGGVTKTTRE